MRLRGPGDAPIRHVLEKCGTCSRPRFSRSWSRRTSLPHGGKYRHGRHHSLAPARFAATVSGTNRGRWCVPVTKCVDDYSGYVSYGDWAPAFREANDEAIAGGSGSTVTYGRDRTAYDIRSQIPVGSNGITITLQGLNGAVLHLRAFTGSDLNAISLRPGSTLDSVIVNGHLVSGISGVIVNADAHVTNGCQFAYMDQYGANVGGAGNVDGSVFSYNGLSGILVQSVVSGAYIYGNTSSHNGEDGIDNSAASNSIIRNKRMRVQRASRAQWGSTRHPLDGRKRQRRRR